MNDGKVQPAPPMRQLFAAGVIKPKTNAQRCEDLDYTPMRFRVWDQDTETFSARRMPPEVA